MDNVYCSTVYSSEWQKLVQMNLGCIHSIAYQASIRENEVASNVPAWKTARHGVKWRKLVTEQDV